MLFEELQRPGPRGRTFVPFDCDLSDWQQLAPLFSDLELLPLTSREQLEHWVHDEDELMSCLWEENYRRIAATQADVNAQKRGHAKKGTSLFFIDAGASELRRSASCPAPRVPSRPA